MQCSALLILLRQYRDLRARYAFPMPPRVLHLSTYDSNGGAARAAYTLHKAMVTEGINSVMLVGSKATADPTVRQVNSTRFRAARLADQQLWRLQRSAIETWRSPARFSAVSAQEINKSGADIVHLHWVTDGFLSIEELGRIRKPLVWSMYDMWPFTGTEHYSPDRPDARWRSGFTAKNRARGDGGWDLERWAFKRKLRHWGRHGSIHMVPASTWLADATETSALMNDWPVTRIPHLVDTDVFTPIDAKEARSSLGLPQAPTVTFLASAGIDDERKGWDLLEKALPHVLPSHPNLQVVVVGPPPQLDRKQRAEQLAAVPIHWYGFASNNLELRLLYAAGDVTAVPSREDNMPLTAMEAQSCGRPVVGFHVGGLPDVVDSGTTGVLAPALDVTALADGLCQAISAEQSSETFGISARQRALSTWSQKVVVDQYLELYRGTLM